MANNKNIKTIGRQFQPGNKAALGNKKLPPDVYEARRMTATDFARLVTRYLKFDRAQIEAAKANPDAPMLEVLVANMVYQASVKSDFNRANFLLDRVIGKPKHSVSADLSFNFTQMPREKVIEIGMDAIHYLQTSPEAIAAAEEAKHMDVTNADPPT